MTTVCTFSPILTLGVDGVEFGYFVVISIVRRWTLSVIRYSIAIIAIQIEHSSHFVKTRHPWQLLVLAYLMQNLRLRGRPPPIIFARIVRPMNVLQLCADSFHRRNLLGATSENRSKIGDFAPTRSLWRKISGRTGRPPPIIFVWIVRPMNALYNFALTVFTERNFVADFLQTKCDFRGKTALLRFWAPLWGTYGQRRMIILGSLESAYWTSC